MKIDQIEMYVIAAFAAFGVLWTFIILPFLSSSLWFASISPPIQYLLFNIGYVFIFSLIVGLPLSFYKKGLSGIVVVDILLTGFVIFLISSFIYDLWQAPFAIDTSGRFLMFEPKSMITASSDYMLAWTYRSFLPTDFLFSGILGISWLYILVYLLPPILTVILAALVFFPEKFLSLLGV